MLILKQSTASQAVLIGPFIDDTDGKTAETGLTIANTDIRLSKNGGNMAAKNSGGGTHDEAGWYAATLDATDTDTVGRLQLSVDVAGALPVWGEFQVVEEDTYTWFFASGAAPDTQVAAIKTVVDAIPTTAMRGTDNAATATSLVTLTDALVLTSAIIETVTSQTQFVIPATADATDDEAYHGTTAVFIDGTDPNQKSVRLVTDYDAGTRTVTVQTAPDFTITTSDTITILTCAYTEGIWDQILTGATHNINTSAGKRLRQLAQAFTLASGTINTVTNGHTITLDTGAVDTEGFYEHARLQIIEGTGAGQTRIIVDYGSDRVCILDSDFTTNPDTASLYEIVAADVHTSISSTDLAEGFVATATSTTTITLDSGAVATTDYYKDRRIIFTHGTGAGQSAEITAYTSGRVCTLAPALTTAVSTDTVWHIVDAVDVTDLVDDIWNEALSGHTTAGSAGKALTDTEADADAIKTVTDKFVFTNTNEVDANTKSINDAEVVGDGNATPWDGV